MASGREWDTRVGTVDLQIPKLREGTYFPSLLEPRRRHERALLSVIQEAYVHGVSTRVPSSTKTAYIRPPRASSKSFISSSRVRVAISMRIGAAYRRLRPDCAQASPTSRPVPKRGETICLVPARRFELRTLGLKDRCSNQAELRRLPRF